MIRRYGVSNGFGWRQGEVMAARVVSIPMAVPLAEARRTFAGLSIALGLVFLLAVGLLDWVLYIFLLRSSSLSDRASPGTAGGAGL